MVRGKTSASSIPSSGSATAPGRSGGWSCRRDAWFRWHRDWLVVRPRTPGRSAAGPTRRTACSASRFPRSSPASGDLSPLFEPGPRQALQNFFWCGDSLVVSLLDDLSPAFARLTPSAQGWARAPIAGLPRDRHGAGLEPRCRGGGIERRAARQRAGPADAAGAAAAAPRGRAGGAEARAAGLRPRRPRRDAPRGGRRATAPQSPISRWDRRARPARRRSISPAMAASPFRCCRPTTPRSASSGWSAAAPASSPTSVAAANTGRLARGRAARGQAPLA